MKLNKPLVLTPEEAPHALRFEGAEPLTQQQHKDECDINNIIARVARGGSVSGNTQAPIYADVSSVPDYRTALDIVLHAEDSFNSLDARVRARFDNDPSKMIDFLSDERNRAEALELGLLEKPADLPPASPKA